uniref:RIN4 pathogenic type III effector avirulence factor Avr cleavage site domain-containing protein n=1 Tax=Oryza brachyantha TaxID=4533 RepID=J3LPY6_ORYBR
MEKGSPLPKFGEWDVNDPASAEGFTVMFNKARDEKKTSGNSQGQDLPAKSEQPSGQGLYLAKPNSSEACWNVTGLHTPNRKTLLHFICRKKLIIQFT